MDNMPYLTLFTSKINVPVSNIFKSRGITKKVNIKTKEHALIKAPANMQLVHIDLSVMEHVSSDIQNVRPKTNTKGMQPRVINNVCPVIIKESLKFNIYIFFAFLSHRDNITNKSIIRATQNINIVFKLIFLYLDFYF